MLFCKILSTKLITVIYPTSVRFASNYNFPGGFRFVQFIKNKDKYQRVGIQIGHNGDVVDLTESGLPNALLECLYIDNFLERAMKLYHIRKNVVSKFHSRILPPITSPDKVICATANYNGYCKAAQIPAPPKPILFNKFPSTIIGPTDTIILPQTSTKVDWEAELAIVIGKTCKDVEVRDAEDYIFGYTLAQDITARDWNNKEQDAVLGKSMDTFCPLGPAVVIKGDFDPHKLRIRTLLNGKTKQNSTTSDLIFKIDFLVSYLSKLRTLLPGDVILTGTPDGVGDQNNPQRFLKSGDVLKTEIEHLGQMVNRVQ